MFRCPSLFLLGISLSASFLGAAEVQVSPALSLTQALQQVREWRKAGNNEPATLILPEGITEITQPLVLEAQDSQLTITGKGASLIGAPIVTGWQAHAGEILKAGVSKLLPKGFLPKQLLFAGQRQVLARYPNFDAADPLYGGWAFVAEFAPGGAPEGHQWKKTLYVKPEDVRQWAHPEEVEINVFAQYGWWNFIEPVISLNPETRLLTMKKNCVYDYHPHNRFHFQNALEELDAPGEWYHDKRTGTLYFWPPQPIEGHEVRLPTLDTFFKVSSNAKNITLRGLTFIGCTSTAISFEGAVDCVVERCVITTVGDFNGSGISVSEGKNVRISRNEISYTGSNGISLSGGDRKTLTGPGHIAEDNHIHHMGVYRKHASAISMQGVDITAAHNHIHDGPRAGVQMSGNNLIVEFNHLHHLMLETQDGGAIYTGGRDWISSRGSKWRYNKIHDIIGVGQGEGGLKHPWFTFGLYPDDNSGGLDIIGNVVFRVAHTPIHLHNSRDCLVENNIFALGRRFQFDLHGWSKSQSSYVTHLPTMVKGYESVIHEPAWKDMRNMDLHPKDALREDGTMMSGNVIQHNIMFGDSKDAKYGDIRNASPKWNIIDSNLGWNNGHPIVTGITQVGSDVGEPLLNDNFDAATPGKTPAGWGFNHRPNKDVQLVAADGTLRVDCAYGDDPKNSKSAFHGPSLPVKPGAAYRVRLRIRSSEPTARIGIGFACFKNGEGYWKTATTSIVATDEWQEFEATGRMLRENENQWKPWMKTFWMRMDCDESKGQVFMDDVRITEAESLNEWSAWQAAGWDKNSLIADPLFMDWKNDDWRLKPESPAFKLGFKAIPVEKIGIRAE
ncbi:MAG: right-handed parallel beta-helix repeat-containing protein [Verrucomicrobiota bacterium]